MKISDFKMVVIPEQSRIVQEFLFKNGCRWILDSREKNKLKYLDSSEIQVDNNIIFTGWFNTEDIPELAFEQFKELYMKEEDFFDKAYKSLCKMQQAKNKNYGESALQPLDIFAKHHNYGSRLDEKLARVKNCTDLRKNDVADIIGGLMLICKDRSWDNFEDLID